MNYPQSQRVLNSQSIIAKNVLHLSSDAKCCGLCASKKIKVEALFITTTVESCCETTQNVIPMASIDDMTHESPGCCAYFCKCLLCGTRCQNGRIVCCDCDCSDELLYINYGQNKMIVMELDTQDDPSLVFENLKHRLHAAKGGPMKQRM